MYLLTLYITTLNQRYINFQLLNQNAINLFKEMGDFEKHAGFYVKAFTPSEITGNGQHTKTLFNITFRGYAEMYL